jgi:hypothetical protein
VEVTVIASERYSLMLIITADRRPTACCSLAKPGGLNRPAHPGRPRISLIRPSSRLARALRWSASLSWCAGR